MNKDSPPFPAEQAAREICEAHNKAHADMVCGRSSERGVSDFDDIKDAAAIIQQAIDRSVAETEEKYRKLAMRWDNWADMHLDGPELEVAVKCYNDLLALIPKQEGEK